MVFFTTTFVVYFCGMPRYLDDLWYDQFLVLARSGKISLWQAITDTWNYHLVTDNARLSNIMFVPFLLMPKWVGSTLAALLWSGACVLAFKLLDINIKHSPLVSVALAVWAFLLPWYDGMGVECFQFNYIIPTFLGVLYLRLFFSSSTADSAGSRIGLCALSFFIGLWHEAFTASLLASCGIMFLLNKQWRTPRHYAMLIGILLGMIWFLSWPCSWQKLGEVHSQSDKFGSGRFMFILFQHLSFILLCGLMIASIFVAKMRKTLRDPLVIALLINIAVSLLVHYLTTRTSRTGWWGEFCSVMVVVKVLQPLFKSRYNSYNLLICTPLILLMSVHQLLVDYWSIRIRYTFESAISRHIESGKNVVFTEIADEYSSPLICMYAPDFTSLLSPVGMYFINTYYHPRDDARAFIPVPAELQNITSDSGTPMPVLKGGKDLGIREINGRLVMPTDEEYQGEIYLDIDYGYTKKRGVRVIFFPFVSQADGKRYAFLYPWRQVVPMRLGKICAISGMQ